MFCEGFFLNVCHVYLYAARHGVVSSRCICSAAYGYLPALSHCRRHRPVTGRRRHGGSVMTGDLAAALRRHQRQAKNAAADEDDDCGDATELLQPSSAGCCCPTRRRTGNLQHADAAPQSSTCSR